MTIKYIKQEINRLETLNLTEKDPGIDQTIRDLKGELFEQQTTNHWDSGYICGYKE